MPCFSLSYAKGHSASFHVNGTNGFVSGAFLKSYKLYGEIERLLFKEDTVNASCSSAGQRISSTAISFYL